MREVSFEKNVNIHADGSCLVKFGNTHVLCMASIDEKVPHWLKNTGKGWVTAEYGMLPRSTNTRMDREAAKGKQSGRTQEIQRLIGRSLRSVIDLANLGERQIKVDCDVIQADGGTRCAAITGGWIALKLASDHLVKYQIIDENPIINQVAAISCGIYNDEPILDLDYEEDSNIKTDANFVLNQKNEIIEIQVSAEKEPFSYKDFEKLFELSKSGIEKLIYFQNESIKSE